MVALYIGNGKGLNLFANAYSQKSKLYAILINEKQTYLERSVDILELPKQIDSRILIGDKFLLGYKIMLKVKELLKGEHVEEIIFESKYKDIYFALQYLRYSGDIHHNIKIVDNGCEYSLCSEEEYKFPYYWIKHIEKEAEGLIKNGKISNSTTGEPLLSVIIPYYNLGEYIDETFKSIQDAEYKKIEIIIVNDGSTDISSIKKLDKFKEIENVRIINKENEGLSMARNVGANEAKGKYITFLDADDLIDSKYYRKAISVLENNSDVDIIYSWVEFFEGKEEIWPTFNLSFPYLLLSNMSAAFYIIRKEKFLNYGLNNLEMKEGMEDYDSLISMHENGCKGVAIPEALSLYRYRLNSMSKSFDRRKVVKIYNEIVNNHKAVYKNYSDEIMKLVNTNGPGYLWNNPTLEYPNVILNYNEDASDVKYILIRLLNTRIGKVLLKLLRMYKKSIKDR